MTQTKARPLILTLPAEAKGANGARVVESTLNVLPAGFAQADLLAAAGLSDVTENPENTRAVA